MFIKILFSLKQLHHLFICGKYINYVVHSLTSLVFTNTDTTTSVNPHLDKISRIKVFTITVKMN